jgi:hypothetical protein
MNRRLADTLLERRDSPISGVSVRLPGIGILAPVNADSTNYNHEHEARTREEEILRDLGRELRKLIPPEEWEALDERQRELAFRKAHSLVHIRMRVQHETRVRITDRGYEEKSGEITVPRSDLNGSAEDAVGMLAHELRHAWQWDVVMGRIDGPGRDRDRQNFTDSYLKYDAADRFKYANSELEADARDRAAYVVEGYVGG